MRLTPHVACQQLTELALIEEVDAEDAILIAVCHGCPLRAECPFDPDDLSIRIVQRRGVSERQILRDLLLQRQSCRWHLCTGRERRIDLELSNSEHAFQPA